MSIKNKPILSIRDLLVSKTVISKEAEAAYKKGIKAVKESNKILADMRQSFSFGGEITFEQLATYEVSTAEKPIPYATGINCVVYRLPSEENKLCFYCLFIPKKNQPARYGWHLHPDCTEQVIQLTGTASSLGNSLPPFSVSTFKAGVSHDYIMEEPGSILVTFTKE